MLLTRLACCSLLTLPLTWCLDVNGRKSDASRLVGSQGFVHSAELGRCFSPHVTKVRPTRPQADFESAQLGRDPSMVEARRILKHCGLLD